MDATLARDRALAWLVEESATPVPPIPRGGRDRRRWLDDLLTTRSPGPIPLTVLEDLDTLLASEAAGREVIRLPHPGVHVWRGDITTLAVDAITNAANEQMLGCFVPGHACIDNAIHRMAGPRLRLECAALMSAQGRPEEPGRAKVTGGYHLPAKHVIHTVGPRVANRTPVAADASTLARCYGAVLRRRATAPCLTPP